MRFEVPQFIEVEDKIFGPLTWKQFVYLAGGVGFGVAAFFMLPFYIFLFTAVPLGGLAAALAFYPVNNRPFSIFLEAMFSFYTNSKLYLWRRKGGYAPRKAPPGSEHLPPVGSQKFRSPTSASNLANLSRQLELNSLEKKE